jgi:hypothetical protein
MEAKVVLGVIELDDVAETDVVGALAVALVVVLAAVVDVVVAVAGHAETFRGTPQR